MTALSENDRHNKIRKLTKSNNEGVENESGMTSQILGADEEENLEDALIDLYLSVKIRSNEEIDNYNEDKLVKERHKL